MQETCFSAKKAHVNVHIFTQHHQRSPIIPFPEWISQMDVHLLGVSLHVLKYVFDYFPYILKTGPIGIVVLI